MLEVNEQNKMQNSDSVVVVLVQVDLVPETGG